MTKPSIGRHIMYSKHFSTGRKLSSDQNLPNSAATEQKCSIQKQRIAYIDILSSSFWYRHINITNY